jgi:hypothetical protein
MSIRSIAHPLKDGSGWISEILVAEEIGSDTLESRFVLKPKFATEDVAYNSAFATGRRIVDDKIRGLDIRAVIEEQTRLPSTHRNSFGSRSDDVAMGEQSRGISRRRTFAQRYRVFRAGRKLGISL